MSTLCGFAIFGQTLLGALGLHTHILTLFVVSTAAAWYVAYQDIQLSAKMMLQIEGVSILLVLLLGMIVWAHKGFAIDTAQLTLTDVTPGNVAVGIVLVVFGFSGFESSTSLGDEAKDPLRTIPRSLIQSTLIAGVFFIIMAGIVVLAFHSAAVDLSKTEAPLDFLAHQAGVGFLGKLISVGALLSFFSCTLGCINSTARIFFMMARHGLLNASLGETHQLNKTPYIAIGLSSLLTFLVPAMLNLLSVKTFDNQGYLGTICTYGFLLVYILISIAAPVYLYRLRKLRSQDVLFSILGVAFMLLPV
ncbi:MAG: APC family permease, partial [Chroococcidiopsidaceae cyanobacterium CP_BM_RX_35]|nr:APC family permease [Chroococcidiopsidaceae cyanobacterium CP_BM_RX_35]